MSEKSSKTEKPTQRRLEKAREEGNFLSARQLLGACQFLLAVALLTYGIPGWTRNLIEVTRRVLRRATGPELNAAELISMSRDLLWAPFMPLVAAGAAMVALVVLVQMLLSRFGLSLKKLAPDIQRMNPIRQLAALPRQNVSSAVQAAVLLPLFLYAVYVVYRDNFDAFLRLPLAGLMSGITKAAESFQGVLWKAGAAFLVVGLVEFVRERRRYLGELKMTKQEIREEIKETEGNPQMKARIRRLQRQMARRQMMQRVRTATAVVVNPTHFAVALDYDMDAMQAPRVVAKGREHLALRIRQLAVTCGVPVVENPPLARALYQSAQVGQEIPVFLYRAVAEILAYIHRLTHGPMAPRSGQAMELH